jgi:hypothetical protein
MRGENRSRGRKKMPHQNTNLDHRRDIRSLEEFEKNMRLRTLKEQFLVRVTLAEWKFRGHQVQFFNNGVDNSGGLITDYNAPFRAPDVKIIVDGFEFLADIKNSGVRYKCTFVTTRLHHYVNAGAYILLYYDTNFIEGAHHKMKWHSCAWAVVRPHAIADMLRDHRPQNGGLKWGNKEVIIVKEGNYHNYWQSHKLTFMAEEQ